MGKKAKKMNTTILDLTQDESESITSDDTNTYRIDRLVAGATLAELHEEDPSIANAKNLRQLERIAESKKQRAKEQALQEKATENLTKGLRPWQSALFTELQQENVHPRKIICYIDKVGGSGKSYITEIMKDLEPNEVLVIDSGKSQDMFRIASKIDSPRVVICDCPKAQQSYVNLAALEKLKNGHFSSTKYDSATIRWSRRPHLVIFTNTELHWEDINSNRWSIREIAESIQGIWTSTVCTDKYIQD